MPAVTPTLIMGVLGIVLSAPAWVLFIHAARRLYLFIAAGQPAPGRTNRPLRRGVQVLKEVFFHTELMRHCRGPLACDGRLPHWVAGVV